MTIHTLSAISRRLRQPRGATTLLLVVAVTAAVVTLLPQRGVDPVEAAAWRSGTAGPGRGVAQVLDGLGLFGITGAWWWSATQAAVAVAATWWVAGAARSLLGGWHQPVVSGQRTVQRTIRISEPPAVATATVARVLRAGGLDVRSDEGTDGAIAVTAARGKLGVWALLLVHVALPLLLLGVVAAEAFAFTGQVDVVEGDTVVDAPVAYHDSTHGPWWSATDHRGFALTLDDFAATFHPDGTPDDFVATVQLDGGPVHPVRINHPARTDGMLISLLRYGVAPQLVVTNSATGEVVHDAPVRLAEAERAWGGSMLLHADGRYAVDVALIGAGSTGSDAQGAVPDDPVLLLDVFAVDGGGRGALVDQAVVPVGGRATALDDTLRIEVPDVHMWAGFQISHTAGRWLLLVGAATLLIGLTGALWIDRERISVRLRQDGDGAALAFAASSSRGTDVACARLDALLAALRRGQGGDA